MSDDNVVDAKNAPALGRGGKEAYKAPGSGIALLSVTGMRLVKFDWVVQKSEAGNHMFVGRGPVVDKHGHPSDQSKEMAMYVPYEGQAKDGKHNVDRLWRLLNLTLPEIFTVEKVNGIKSGKMTPPPIAKVLAMLNGLEKIAVSTKVEQSFYQDREIWKTSVSGALSMEYYERTSKWGSPVNALEGDAQKAWNRLNGKGESEKGEGNGERKAGARTNNPFEDEDEDEDGEDDEVKAPTEDAGDIWA